MSDPAPKLDYATPAADGLPDWVPQAEALIDARAHPKKIRPYFRKSGDALAYFVKSMERRYSLNDVPDQCEHCDAPCTNVVGMTWQTKIPPKFIEPGLKSGSSERSFTTFHALCPLSEEYFRRKTRVLDRSMSLLTGATVVVWFGFIGGEVIFRNVLPGARAEWFNYWVVFGVAVSTLVLIVNSLLSHVRTRMTRRMIGDTLPRGVRFDHADVGFDRYVPASSPAS